MTIITCCRQAIIFYLQLLTFTRMEDFFHQQYPTQICDECSPERSKWHHPIFPFPFWSPKSFRIFFCIFNKEKETSIYHLSFCSSNPAIQDAQQQKNTSSITQPPPLRKLLLPPPQPSATCSIDRWIDWVFTVTKWQICSSKYITIEGGGMPSRFLLNGWFVVDWFNDVPPPSNSGKWRFIKILY